MTKKYDKEFKLQTIQMIQEEGKAVAQVARELGNKRQYLVSLDARIQERRCTSFSR
ncbi:transposase [Paenibacillus popilliae]|uniref:transposase n=1 Tax=Paenibacillus popilliae TaxID=78057 RepID=UPI0003061ED5